MKKLAMRLAIALMIIEVIAFEAWVVINIQEHAKAIGLSMHLIQQVVMFLMQSMGR